jgi:transposase-like protein
VDSSSPSIAYTPCTVAQARWSLYSTPCDRCQQPAARVWEVTRTAIDIDLDRPILLAVVVSVHHCAACQHYFRVQPPFLRRDAIYCNRVVLEAVQAVYEDGLALRHVPERLARDFWVRPSEKMVRCWCHAYAAGLDTAGDYQAWVVATFSGVLCVDEVYQGRLALLVAVDPAAPDGDRLVGYQLVRGSVDQTTVAMFLRRLRQAGIEPEQVITDGSPLYPAVLAQIWPAAAHQLCLFHETRRVTAAVLEVASAVRKHLPTAPPPGRPALQGRARKSPPPEDRTDPVTERWRWRTAARLAGIAQVHALRRRGLSLSAIARQTGLNWRTVRAWLRQAVPASAAPNELLLLPPALEEAPPPAPWSSWAEVRRVREDLKLGRGLLLRRPDHLTADEQRQLQAVLDGPAGGEIRLARAFLLDWYAIWRDTHGQRRRPAEARAHYERWRAEPTYARLAPLRRVQQRIDDACFQRLSQFLRNPSWEATNNGAERGGRSFRHGQRPHYNLRSLVTIEDDLKVRAVLRQQRAALPVQPIPRCPRGRATLSVVARLAA